MDNKTTNKEIKKQEAIEALNQERIEFQNEMLEKYKGILTDTEIMDTLY